MGSKILWEWQHDVSLHIGFFRTILMQISVEISDIKVIKFFLYNTCKISETQQMSVAEPATERMKKKITNAFAVQYWALCFCMSYTDSLLSLPNFMVHCPC